MFQFRALHVHLNVPLPLPDDLSGQGYEYVYVHVQGISPRKSGRCRSSCQREIVHAIVFEQAASAFGHDASDCVGCAGHQSVIEAFHGFYQLVHLLLAFFIGFE